MANGPLSAPVFGSPVAGPADAPVQTMVSPLPSGHASQPEDRAVTTIDDTFLTSTDILSVRNDGDSTVVFSWARVDYPIKPGMTGWVPFPALVDKLGDPRSMEGQIVRYSDAHGNRGIVLDRYHEIARLYARYGIRGENLDDETAAALPEEIGKPVSLMGRAPKLHVETLEGKHILFPIDHPKMVALPVADEGARQVPADSRRMMDELREQAAQDRAEIARLERLITSRLGVDPAEDGGDGATGAS